MEPDAQILSQLGLTYLAPLGGRMNHHWLVHRNAEPLVLRRWSPTADDIGYEIRLLNAIAAHGWPVPIILDGPLHLDGTVWTLARYLPGAPGANPGSATEQRARGRLLAELHADLAQLAGFGQRGTWRRCEEILADTDLDTALAAHETRYPEEIRALRWHLDRARQRAAGIPMATRPGQIIHGDFAPWNLHYSNGQLTGILDFELAHWDHRVADFNLAWRGKYDEVIHGYHEVSPLSDTEWEMLTPVWWAYLINLACRLLRAGALDDGWIIRKLLERSPLMGSDAVDYAWVKG